MSADWKEGDRALCIDGSISINTYATGWTCLQKGTVYLVSEVTTNQDQNGRDAVVLCLAGDPESRITSKGNRIGWCCKRFRKIVPACDRKEIHNKATT